MFSIFVYGGSWFGNGASLSSIWVAPWKTWRSWATEKFGDDKIVPSAIQSHEQVQDIYLVEWEKWWAEWWMNEEVTVIKQQRYDGASLWKPFVNTELERGMTESQSPYLTWHISQTVYKCLSWTHGRGGYQQKIEDGVTIQGKNCWKGICCMAK